MRVVFSKHAILKMRHRKLDRKKVLEAIARPDFIEPGYRGREKRYKRFGRLTLQTVVIEEGGLLVVITAHWVAKAG